MMERAAALGQAMVLIETAKKAAAKQVVEGLDPFPMIALISLAMDEFKQGVEDWNIEEDPHELDAIMVLAVGLNVLSLEMMQATAQAWAGE